VSPETPLTLESSEASLNFEGPHNDCTNRVKSCGATALERAIRFDGLHEPKLNQRPLGSEPNERTPPADEQARVPGDSNTP
jgi:hypothetical protein